MMVKKWQVKIEYWRGPWSTPHKNQNVKSKIVRVKDLRILVDRLAHSAASRNPFRRFTIIGTEKPDPGGFWTKFLAVEIDKKKTEILAGRLDRKAWRSENRKARRAS